MYEQERKDEFEKYSRAYAHPDYHMGLARMAASTAALTAVPCRGTYLDVGTGRGEMLQVATSLGFDDVTGTEVIDELLGHDVIFAAVHDLPFADGEFNVVTFLDVLEHILPEDTNVALSELARVASDHLIITAANYSSKSLGEELHINIREYPFWDETLKAEFEPLGAEVIWLPRVNGTNSETWRINLDP